MKLRALSIIVAFGVANYTDRLIRFMQFGSLVHVQPEPDSHVGHMGHHRMPEWSANDLLT